MTKKDIRNILSGGDRRSVGDAPMITAAILRKPALAGTVISLLWEDDPILRSRAAHALRFATLDNPATTQPFKSDLISKMSAIDQWEVREQFCILITKLDLSPKEVNSCLQIFKSYLADKSSIVRTCAMQGLSDLAEKNDSIKAEVLPVLIELTESGSAAMRARGRKLLKRLM